MLRAVAAADAARSVLAAGLLAGRALRWLQSMGIWRPNSWPVGLKQSHANAEAKPLLIWAVGTPETGRPPASSEHATCEASG